MLTLYVTEPNGKLAEFGYLPENFLGDEVDTAVLGSEVDLLLEPGGADLYAPGVAASVGGCHRAKPFDQCCAFGVTGTSTRAARICARPLRDHSRAQPHPLPQQPSTPITIPPRLPVKRPPPIPLFRLGKITIDLTLDVARTPTSATRHFSSFPSRLLFNNQPF